MVPVAGKVYTLEGKDLHGGGFVDSADMPEPYGIRITRTAGNLKNPHGGARIYYDVIGASKPRRKRTGTMLAVTFQRRARRELTSEQAAALARGERVPIPTDES